ncbi:hypothetical protein LTR97_007789 [Elasticomyces elasticus]|uniref:Uncharacterized protein n=1 Tax=Elasticomyces elasticus TaxID=574655 RepID=A0AAN7W5I4_9PEZI|nr:hypothetical protein LTR97_007789 [Elasticomyces elasticus]
MFFKRFFNLELSPETPEHLKAKREMKQEIYKEQYKQDMFERRRKFLERGSLNLAVNIMNPHPVCQGRHSTWLDHQCVVAQLTQQHEQVMKKLEEMDAKIERVAGCKCGENGDKTSSTGL